MVRYGWLQMSVSAVNGKILSGTIENPVRA